MSAPMPAPEVTAPEVTPAEVPSPDEPPAGGRTPARIIPRATYRLQLHRDFNLRAAIRALPYLARLGVSHVYCSPILMARPGSTHGYDVVDPTRLNPDLGTAHDFGSFCRALTDHGLGLILDIVPNHMGVDSEANGWWQDVLRLGPASAHAPWFDIDWAAGGQRLLLPILGGSLDDVIASGDLTIDAAEDPPSLRCHERRLPINAAGLACLQASRNTPRYAPRDAPRDAHRIAAGNAPREDAGDDDGCSEDDVTDPRLVRAVADRQHYELADWREAATRINYRRFFDVSTLAAIRVETPAVFDATHALVLAWVREGLVDGLRIDHPDGLRDPGAYFHRLQQAAGDRRGRLYLVAEKILAPQEDMPRDWPIDGTTGYDFANLVCGVLIDETSLPAVDATWRDYTGETTASFSDLTRQTRHEVLETTFGGELATLGRRLLLALRAQPDPQQPLPLAMTALAELIACFPVYRTYPGSDHASADRRVIDEAVTAAARHLEPAGQSMLTTIGHLLAAGLTGDAAGDEFVVRFQQLVSPVVAKGVEDTALYRWSRLVSLNDVGGDPDHYGVDVAGFHDANRRRAATWPQAMLATSTHDNKRSEYVRLRINALSEDPAHWRALVDRWSAALDRESNAAGLLVRPTRSDCILLFQTLIGSAPSDPALLAADWRWPAPAAETLADYAARIKAYMLKAGREAKRRTSWLEPDDDYERAVARTIDLIFASPDLTREWLADIRPFAWWGGLNSLTATVLKLTSPGVPDIYQGARVLDDSLVDPDNRRPVDFDERLPVIEDLARLAASEGARIETCLGAWLAGGDFPRLKLWIIQRLLHWRRDHPALFDAGSYEAVPVRGRLARHVIAFVRRHGDEAVLVVATRLYRRAGFVPRDYSPADVPPSPWTDESLDLAAFGLSPLDPLEPLAPPEALAQPGGAAAAWRDLLREPSSSATDGKASASLQDGPAPTSQPPQPSPRPRTDRSASQLTVGELLARLPVAVLPLGRTGTTVTPRQTSAGPNRPPAGSDHEVTRLPPS